MIGSPDPLDAELEWPWHSINQANPNRLHLLSEQLCLWLYHNPVVRPYEFIPLYKHSLPLTWPPGV